MEGIVNHRNISHCYDVFDRKGDGAVEIMGVQYYIAFRHTQSRVAKEICTATRSTARSSCWIDVPGPAALDQVPPAAGFFAASGFGSSRRTARRVSLAMKEPR